MRLLCCCCIGASRSLLLSGSRYLSGCHGNNNSILRPNHIHILSLSQGTRHGNTKYDVQSLQIRAPLHISSLLSGCQGWSSLKSASDLSSSASKTPPLAPTWPALRTRLVSLSFFWSSLLSCLDRLAQREEQVSSPPWNSWQSIGIFIKPARWER